MALHEPDRKALLDLARAAEEIADRPGLSEATAFWIREGAAELSRRAAPPTPEPRRPLLPQGR